MDDTTQETGLFTGAQNSVNEPKPYTYGHAVNGMQGVNSPPYARDDEDDLTKGYRLAYTAMMLPVGHERKNEAVEAFKAHADILDPSGISWAYFPSPSPIICGHASYDTQESDTLRALGAVDKEKWKETYFVTAAKSGDAKKAFDPFTKTIAPPFDPECWPAPVAAYALSRSKATGTDANAFACAALQAASVAIHPLSKIHMQPGGDWAEPPVLWFGLIAPSGGNKSAVIKANRHHANAREAAEVERFAKDAAIIKETYGDEPTKKDEKEMEAEFERNRPIRALAPDATPEAMQNVMASPGQKGWGLNVCVDEGMRTLEAIDKYGPNRQHWLSGFDCVEGHNVDRVGRGSITIPVWSIGFFGGIQMKALQETKINPTSDGLMQRIIPCIMEEAIFPEIGPLEGPPPTAPCVLQINGAIRASYARDPGVFRFSDEAHHIRHAFLKDNFDIAKGLGDQPIGQHINKMRGVFGRVCAAFHTLEGHGPETKITKQTAATAMKLFSDFELDR